MVKIWTKSVWVKHQPRLYLKVPVLIKKRVYVFLKISLPSCQRKNKSTQLSAQRARKGVTFDDNNSHYEKYEFSRSIRWCLCTEERSQRDQRVACKSIRWYVQINFSESRYGKKRLGRQSTISSQSLPCNIWRDTRTLSFISRGKSKNDKIEKNKWNW